MLTKKDADEFIEEFQKDLAVFHTAYNCLRRRCLETEDTGHDRYFGKSSGVIALSHLLIMNIAQVEGILDDLRAKRSELPDQALRLVEQEDEASNV